MNALEDTLRSATAASLLDWTDPRMVVRGEEYLGKVLEMADAGDFGVVASVRGTADYFTRVFLDNAGGLESECSCPVHRRCKHAVAVILKCAKRLANGDPAWNQVADSAFLREAREAIAASAARREEGRKEAARAQEASSAGTGESDAGEWHDAQNEKEWDDYVAGLESGREKVLAACAQGEREDIFAAVDRFLQHMIPEYGPPTEEQSERSRICIDSTMETAIGALRKSGMDEDDLIVWAIGLADPEHSLVYDDVGHPIYELASPPEEQAPDAEVWRRVAGKLEAWIEGLCAADGKGGGEPQRQYLLEALRKAWRRAGDESRAADCWMRHASWAGYWKEAADFLNFVGRHDDAIQVAREGIRVSARTSDYGNDYDRRLLEPLADAFSGKGDHPKATAILAEQFLSWMGAYEFHRTTASFAKVLEEAERAGVKEEVRAAILQALKTGVNPVPLQDHVFKATAANRWCPVPKKVEYTAPDALPETPPWPLPRSGEGNGGFSDSRWKTNWAWCQYDQEFLLKLALENGDAEEIAFRFCNLPEYPRSSSCYLRDVGPMLRAVREKMLGFRPDIIEAIDNPRLHWAEIEKRPRFAASQPAWEVVREASPAWERHPK